MSTLTRRVLTANRAAHAAQMFEVGQRLERDDRPLRADVERAPRLVGSGRGARSYIQLLAHYLGAAAVIQLVPWA